MVSKFVLSLVPRPFTAVMIAIAIPAAIKPYSMAVAPDSSRMNDLMINFMSGSDLVALTEPRFPRSSYPGIYGDESKGVLTANTQLVRVTPGQICSNSIEAPH